MNTTDSTARLADTQVQGLEHAFAFGRAATGMFERLARQNYAVMGDVVDYTLAQIRIPTRHADPRAALEAQAAGTRQLAEKARVRADEYAAIVGEMSGMVNGAMGRAAKVAAGKKAAPAGTAAPASGTTRAATPAAPVAPARGAPKPVTDAGGTPIVLPSDSPKVAARKAAAAKPAAKRPVAGKGAEAKLATKAAAKPAAKGRPAARSAAKSTTKGAVAGKSGRGAKD